jgi:hypothetical protein
LVGFFLWYFIDGFVLFGGLAGLGKTVPAYRWALESEIDTWWGFRRALTNDADKQAFEAKMDLCRIFASESSNATNPIIFEPIVMSILMGQQKRIQQLEYKLQNLPEEKNGKSTHG